MDHEVSLTAKYMNLYSSFNVAGVADSLLRLCTNSGEIDFIGTYILDYCQTSRIEEEKEYWGNKYENIKCSPFDTHLRIPLFASDKDSDQLCDYVNDHAGSSGSEVHVPNLKRDSARSSILSVPSPHKRQRDKTPSEEGDRRNGDLQALIEDCIVTRGLSVSVSDISGLEFAKQTVLFNKMIKY